MLSRQEEEHERRAVMRNDARVRDQERSGTYLSHTHDDAGGRFAAIRVIFSLVWLVSTQPCASRRYFVI